MNDIIKIRQTWLVKKSKLSEEKKTTRAQILRYFRYKSRNNKPHKVQIVLRAFQKYSDRFLLFKSANKLTKIENRLFQILLKTKT